MKKIISYTSQFTITPAHSVYDGREPISFIGPKTWVLIPLAIRQINSLSLSPPYRINFEKKNKY